MVENELTDLELHALYSIRRALTTICEKNTDVNCYDCPLMVDGYHDDDYHDNCLLTHLNTVIHAHQDRCSAAARDKEEEDKILLEKYLKEIKRICNKPSMEHRVSNVLDVIHNTEKDGGIKSKPYTIL